MHFLFLGFHIYGYKLDWLHFNKYIIEVALDYILYVYIIRGVNIFQKSRSHLRILGT